MFLDDIASPTERIRRKLAVARLVDHFREVFGTSHHDYILHPPVSIDTVRSYEARRGISLPEPYVRFVTEVGDGGAGRPGWTTEGFGAGPGYGLMPLEHEGWAREKKLMRCEALIGSLSKTEWRRRFQAVDELDDEAADALSDSIHHGVFTLTEGGCSDFHGLILSGPARGAVINSNWEYDFPDGPPEIIDTDFLSWYETWLDDILGDRVRKSWRDHGLGPRELFHCLKDDLADRTAGRHSDLHLQMIGGLPRLKPKRIATLREYHETTDDPRVRDYCLALLAQFDPDNTHPLLVDASDALLIHILTTRAPSLIPSFTDRLNQMRDSSQDLADAVALVLSA
ncbi:MAG: hypothetical protein Q4D96_05485 [Propionibacteriaceae bacterium]|nr:hypothetical protein [Propionibacteriaceae bacterium]